MTWQQVEIMRGESPKSYVWVARGQTDLLRSSVRRTEWRQSSPIGGRWESSVLGIRLLCCICWNIMLYLMLYIHVVHTFTIKLYKRVQLIFLFIMALTLNWILHIIYYKSQTSLLQKLFHRPSIGELCLHSVLRTDDLKRSVWPHMTRG